jgi:2,4-didehydro-3-deoxy-L-rhamnonate hydrolase
MRLVTFTHGGASRAGILLGEGSGSGDVVIDLAHAEMRPRLNGIAPDVAALVGAGLHRLEDAMAARGAPAAARLPLADVRLLAPIPQPRRIIGIAHNFVDALAERQMAHPAEPIVFVKEPATVVGPGATVVLPAGNGGVTYEAELAAVIGTRADRVAPEQALKHVAGYCAFNDISASELIKREGRFDRGKNFPTFGPMGPFLATASEIGDPQALRIRFSVDGEVLQDGTTAMMLFSVAELIARLSRSAPLEPGDIIATGTPAGVAPMRRPPAWLRPGTTLTTFVERLGTLTNPVIEKDYSNV